MPPYRPYDPRCCGRMCVGVLRGASCPVGDQPAKTELTSNPFLMSERLEQQLLAHIGHMTDLEPVGQLRRQACPHPRAGPARPPCGRARREDMVPSKGSWPPHGRPFHPRCARAEAMRTASPWQLRRKAQSDLLVASSSSSRFSRSLVLRNWKEPGFQRPPVGASKEYVSRPIRVAVPAHTAPPTWPTRVKHAGARSRFRSCPAPNPQGAAEFGSVS